jgi:hypothetical protein
LELQEIGDLVESVRNLQVVHAPNIRKQLWATTRLACSPLPAFRRRKNGLDALRIASRLPQKLS